MSRSLKPAAICRVFAIRKDRNIVRKAKTNDYAALRAPAAAFYRLCGSLRGLLCAVTTGTHAHESTHQRHWSWMPGMQPCLSTVRRLSPGIVVTA